MTGMGNTDGLFVTMGGQQMKRNLNFGYTKKKSLLEQSHENTTLNFGAKNSGYTTATGYPNLMEKSGSSGFLKGKEDTRFTQPITSNNFPPTDPTLKIFYSRQRPLLEQNCKSHVQKSRAHRYRLPLQSIPNQPWTFHQILRHHPRPKPSRHSQYGPDPIPQALSQAPSQNPSQKEQRIPDSPRQPPPPPIPAIFQRASRAQPAA
jgi:hypothetical protein